MDSYGFSHPLFVISSPRELVIIDKKEKEKKKAKHMVVSSSTLFDYLFNGKAKGNPHKEIAFLSRFVVQTEASENVQCEQCKNSYHMGKECGVQVLAGRTPTELSWSLQ